MSKRILVFPCGSEIGLEIHRALRYSVHFELVGASSVDDHGRFVYERYIGGLPFHDNPAFATSLKKLIREKHIDAVYPTMDAVAETLQNLAHELGVRIIGSPIETTRICASKRLTYSALAGLVPTPTVYPSIDAVPSYPIFIKPDRGYGSRHAARIDDPANASASLAQYAPNQMLILEHLPGKEWTIDCFSDRHGTLLFSAARERARISNGISVRTLPSTEFSAEFSNWAKVINEKLKPRGAWFFQAKVARDGNPKLLEVAARFAGSSAVQRARGVNLPLLSVFDAFDYPVSISQNDYPVTLDRALENKYKIDLEFQHVYVDLDDCILLNEKVNHTLIAFLYRAINEGCTITLLTRHKGDLKKTLQRARIHHLFDEIIHIDRKENKADFINAESAIFIDDSHRERHSVASRLKIPVFAPDMIETLL